MPNPSAVIVFDWDDTLFPTSWLRSFGSRHLPTAQLKSHASAAVAALRAARAVGRVAIVTLAKPGWVTRTASEYLAEMHVTSLLAELDIEVLYAREFDICGAFEAGDYKKLKRNAMRRVVLQQCRRSSGCSGALSIGDDAVERDAMRSLLADRTLFAEFPTQPVCKTLKLMKKPSLTQLTEELQRLTPLLPTFVTRQSSFDGSVSSPADLSAANLRL